MQFWLGTIKKLCHPVVAPTGSGKNDGSMDAQGWLVKQKMMHDGLGSGPLLNVAIFGIITTGHSMKLPQNIHHNDFCVFNKHISFVLNTRRMMTTPHWSAKT